MTLKITSLSLMLGIAVMTTAGCASKHGAKVSAPDTAVPRATVTSAAALERLQAGNARFTQGKTAWAGVDSKTIAAHTAGQNPSAIVLSCADSRVPVEHIFDAGVGDLFVLRVAGNVATSEALGSAEYAIAALNTPLVVVMGHGSCGAVAGALKVKQSPPFPDHLQHLLEDIESTLAEEGAASASVDEAVRANVRAQVAEVLADPLVQDRVAAGKLQVVGAVYDLASGRVDFMQ